MPSFRDRYGIKFHANKEENISIIQNLNLWDYCTQSPNGVSHINMDIENGEAVMELFEKHKFDATI